MRLLSVPRPETGCLSYLVVDPHAAACLLVDPAQDPSNALLQAEKLGVAVTSILETHTHADHISGARALGARLQVPVHLPALSRSTYPHRPYREGTALRVGDVELRAIHTPGHTHDSMCLVVDGHALVGDALLVGTVGRADFYPEGPEEAYHTVFDKLLKMDDALKIHPAHFGPLQGLPTRTSTTLGRERLRNEALTQKSKADFVRYMTEGWPPKPHGWERIVATNRKGWAPGAGR